MIAWIQFSRDYVDAQELQVKASFFLLNTELAMFSQVWWNQSLHLMHWAIFLWSCGILHEQYTLIFSSLTTSSSSILRSCNSHPGNGLIFPCSNDFNRWARISFWSQRMELGDSPLHKEVAAAIANRAQSLPPSCNWELVIRIVKWGAEQWSKAAICLMMWGIPFHTSCHICWCY